jgi:5'-methylthioadenosine phosphorylase
MVNSPNDVKIAIIGGSGLYNLEGLEVIEEVNPETVKYLNL